MENLKQFIRDEKGNTIGVQDAKFYINQVIGWISDHDQLYKDFQDHFDYTYDEASGEESNRPELDDALYWISEHETAWEDFKLYFNIIEEDELTKEEIKINHPSYGIAYCKYDVGFLNSKSERDEVQIKVKRNDDSIEEERLDLINEIIKLSKKKDIKEVTYIDYVDEDEDDDDYYDARHAQEWMERNPHGYYNSEKDYGVDDEDDTLEYAFKDNFR